MTDDEHPLVVDGCGGAGGDGEADEEDEAPLAEVFGAQRARGRARAADDAVSRSLRQRPAASTGGGRGSMATVSGDVPFSILWRRSKSPGGEHEAKSFADFPMDLWSCGQMLPGLGRSTCPIPLGMFRVPITIARNRILDHVKNALVCFEFPSRSHETGYWTT